MNLSNASDEFLFKTQRWAHVKFMMRPSRIYRLFRDFPDYGLIWPAIRVWSGFFTGAGKGHRPGKPGMLPGSSKKGWKH